MSKQKHPFNLRLALGAALLVWGASVPASAETASADFSKRDASLYQDVFDQNLYYEGTQYLHLERLYRGLFGAQKRALNVNPFDEVPDSTFFTNRQGRQPLSEEELRRGPSVTDGPDPGGEWAITKGKFEGLTPGFFVRDKKGDAYLLKFDSLDHLELTTSAEPITSRFMHAIGYFVPQYSVVTFKREQLGIDPNAKIYDQTGFRKKLTPERLEEFLLFLPTTEDGRYRASASRIVEGEILGPMKFQGRRRNDPEDLVDHKDRREIRALQVFASWINNNDIRESNSLEVVRETEGRRRIWHYLIDFGSSLGSTAGGPKPPFFGYEYMFDFKETFKAILGLGFWEKPWQKRWRENGEEISNPSLGYFDNRHFNPGRFKTQLPYFPFKDLTRSDGFWAAKILMRFTDSDIRAVVSTGKLSDQKTEEEIANLLIERRDLVGRFWFTQANPLDEFQLFRQGDGRYELRFEDLAVRYQFFPDTGNHYHFDVIVKQGKRALHLAKQETETQTFSIPAEWLKKYPAVDLLIRTQRPGEKAWSPFVRVEIKSGADTARLAGILHQD